MDSVRLELTLRSLVDFSASKHENDVFLLAHDKKFNQQSVTFGQFQINVVQAAARLQEVGVTKGARVAVLMDINESTITTIMAVIFLGAVVVLVDKRTPPHILTQMFKSCRVSLVCVGDVTDPNLQSALGDLKIIDATHVTQKRSMNGPEHAHFEEVTASDPVVIMFTSGTTSLPKAVVHTHSNLLHSVKSKFSAVEPLLVANGVVLGTLPLFHVMGFTNTLLFCLFNGLQYAIFESPITPELTAFAIKKLSPFTFGTVPWVAEELAILCKSDPVLLAEMAKLKYLTCGGAKLSHGVSQFYESNQILLVLDWGQTELGGGALSGGILPQDLESWRWMRPLPGFAARIVPVEGVQEGGELVIVDCKTLALGYIVDGELIPLSRSAYHTGDIFIQNEDGAYSILYRKDNIIVHANGEKTNPFPFMTMKHKCPVIEQVCVIGNSRPHNMLLIQVTEQVVSVQLEEEIWNCVNVINADFAPHSRVRRHQILLIPASSPVRIPVSEKGEVIVHKAQDLFAEQITKVYKSTSFLDTKYPAGFLDAMKHKTRFEQRSAMISLVRDVLSAVLGVDPSHLDVDTSFGSQSVRSFEAIQVRNTLSGILKHGQLPATMLYDNPTISSLGDWLLQEIGLVENVKNIEKPIASTEQPAEPMAIIGVGCRFGGGIKDLLSFWELISNGIDTVNLIPPERWDWEKYYDPAGGPGKMRFCEGSFISQVDQFDADLFGILPNEAHQMDPQHRVLLETTWEAIEHSGYSPASLQGSNTGVFMGLLHHDYMTGVQKEHGDLMTIDTYYGSGNTFSSACGHISYLLDLRGPSISLDTACSSSLVALQLACQSLQARESDQCLVGGVNMMLSPHNCIYLSQAGMTSPDGRCKAFDASANGFGRGEGCGVVVVKRLEDALAAHDNILSIVCSVAVNHDGKSNGFTAPSRAAQERVIDAALKRANLEPSNIGFLEAHGTGTVIGDNIEIQAAGATLGRNRPKDSPLLIGSVKTNIAHTEAAAGVASLIKATLCLQHAIVPKLALFQTQNPNVNLEQIPAIIPTTNFNWTTNGAPRYASINSFGFSGTNAHAILKEAPKAEPEPCQPSHHYILPLSACPKNPRALDDIVAQFHTYLRSTKDDIDNICFTAQCVRSFFRLRTPFVGTSKEELLDALQRYINKEPDALSCNTNTVPKTVMIVPGDCIIDGKFKIAQSMYKNLHSFKESILSALTQINQVQDSFIVLDKWLESTLPASLTSAQQELVTVVLEYAGLCVWKSWGVVPQTIYARSAGVYAALCANEVLTVSEIAKVIIARQNPVVNANAQMKNQIVAEQCPQPLCSITGLMVFDDLSKIVDSETVLFGVLGCEYTRDLGTQSVVLSAPRHLQNVGYMSALALLAKLYVAGVDVLWQEFHTSLSQQLRKVVLPFYPFQHQRYWYPPYTKKNSAVSNGDLQQLPYLLLHTVDSSANTHIFSGTISLSGDTKFLEEHKVLGNIIFPMTGYIEMALESASTFINDNVIVKNFVVLEPFVLRTGQSYIVKLVAVANQASDLFAFEIVSRVATNSAETTLQWKRHVTGTIAATQEAERKHEPVPTQKRQELGVDYYSRIRALGFEYGPHFNCMTTGFVDEKSSLIKLHLDEGQDDKVIFHPGLFDCCLHSMQLFFTVNAPSEQHIHLPVSFDSFVCKGKITSSLTSMFVPTTRFAHDSETLSGNISIFDAHGASIAEFSGIQIKRTMKAQLQPRLQASSLSPSDLYYSMDWEPSSHTGVSQSSANILLFTESNPVSEAIATYIKNNANKATKAMTVSLTPETSLAAVLKDPFWENKPPAHIVYIATENAKVSDEPLSSQFKLMAHSLLLTQSVIKHKFQKAPQLWFVTKNATWVGGEELNVFSSPIWGFGAAVCLEHPELRCKRVDVDSEDCGELLLQELQLQSPEDQVGFRKGQRYVIRLNNQPHPVRHEYVCDPNASYIVTGGFGGIGVKSVDMLIDLGARHIVVISRSGVPPAGKAQQSVDKWRAAGIDIDGQGVNMGDFDRLQTIFKNLKYPLKGILHAAGIAEDSTLKRINWSKFESVFGPKVYGSWNLHLLTKEMKLDFFVFYSSISASLGNFGQSNYAAANYFMDALARYRRGLGLPGVSINWGAWGEVGIAADRNLAATLKKKGILSFPPAVGIAALRTLLIQSPSDSITVLWADWEIILRGFQTMPQYFSNIAKTSRPSSKPESAALSKLAQTNDFDAALREYVTQEIASTVGLSGRQIDPDRHLPEFGMDSLVATQLRNNFEKALVLSLPVSFAFEYPTVNLIFQYLQPLVLEKLKKNETTNKLNNQDEKSKSAERVSSPKSFYLTLAQQGLWWIWKITPHSTAYNVAFYYKFNSGDFDTDLIHKCWNDVIASCDVMRSVFVAESSGLIVHKILPRIQNSFSAIQVANDAELSVAMHQVYNAPFDLATGPLYRFAVFSTGISRVVLIVAHHIVSDASSEITIFEHMFKLYNNYKKGKPMQLQVGPQYSEFVAYSEQQLKLHGERLWQHWKNYLGGRIPYLNFYFAQKKQIVQSKPMGASYPFSIGHEIKAKVETVAKSLGITVYHVLLTGYLILLQKYTKQHEIVVGTFINSRSTSQFEELIGLCVETILVKGDFSADPTAAESFVKVSKSVIQAMINVYPLPALMDKLNRTYGRSSVQAVFSFLQIVGDTLDYGKNEHIPPLEPLSVIIQQQEGQFDISLEVDGTKDLSSMIRYNPQIFHKEQIKIMGNHMVTLISNLCDRLSLPVSKIGFVTASDYDLLINKWNETERDYPSENLRIYDMIEQQIQRVPNDIAIVFNGKSITYSQLAIQVSQLADVLVHFGVGPNITCGVFIERSPSALIAALAIWKIGGTYLPLEVDNPPARVALMITDTNATVLLTTETNLNSLKTTSNAQQLFAQLSERIIYLDQPLPHVEQPPTTQLTQGTRNPEDVAFIIYSSGSTGIPKGILLHYRGITNTFLWMLEQYKLQVDDRVLCKAPLGWDMSIFEFLWAFTNGVPCVIARQGGLQNPDYMLELIQQEKVTIVHFVPSYLQVLVEFPNFIATTSNVSLFLLVGEVVPRSLYHILGKRLHNMYGPTEASFVCSFFSCESFEENEMPCNTIPIGKPFGNVKLYILDPNMQPVPLGVAGELYISGPNVGPGYLNSTEQTQRCFLPNPFNSPWRMFKTGDLARHLHTGDLEVVGRLDDQVKIGGNRIELGEINAALLQHEKVKEVVAHVYEASGYKSLVAYIKLKIPTENFEGLKEELRQFLSGFLPYYMVPTHFVFLSEIPLNSNNKVNRAALPPPVAQKQEVVLDEPVRSVQFEIDIRNLWAELNVHVTRNNQSFYNHGGSSLIAMRFLNKFQQKFNKKLQVSEFLKDPTINGISKIFLGDAESISTLPCAALNTGNEDIAIVGMSCRFPGSSSLSQYWDLLYTGKDAIQEAILIDGNENELPITGGFISNIAEFDPYPL